LFTAGLTALQTMFDVFLSLRGSLPRLGRILATLLAGACFFSCSKQSSSQGVQAFKREELVIEAKQVSRKEIQRVIDITGTLLPNEEVVVSSEVDGPVEKVLVDLGDRVKRSQLLVKISAREFELSVDRYLAELQQALARLGLNEEDEQLRSDHDATEVRRAAAQMDEAEQKYKRAEELFREGVVSKEGRDEAEARYKSARASYDSALQTVQSLKAQIKQNRAALQLARKKLQDTDIRAPFDGFVKERLVSIGQYLTVQTPVVSLVQTDPLKARAEVPEKAVPSIREGQAVGITVDAFDRTFQGRISRVSPAVNHQTRALTIEALIDNKDQLLKPGYFAKTKVTSHEKEIVVSVPADTILNFFGVNKVFVVENGKIHEKVIKLGDRFGDDVEVLEGVKGGETVASSELSRLENDLPVRIR
jgi:multidrug efflux pump subunit AcrA (membrane-fusion protein)